MTNAPAQSKWVYLDNNATTRTDQRVVDAMLPCYQDQYANPSSMHDLGAMAASAIRAARIQIGALIGANRDSEIVFTSGGSESNNTAIFSALQTQPGRNEIVTSTVEHPAVLAVCDYLELMGKVKVHRIPVDRCGSLNLDAYRSALSTRTALVSIQWANNETGVVFPVEMLASMAHKTGAFFHCDAVQAAGRVAMNVAAAKIDMLSISAHKMHGPKGIGALYVRSGIKFSPLIHGGRQERGRRAGTENTPAIVGFGVAAELALQALPHEMKRIALLRDSLEREILRRVPGSILIGDSGNRLPNTLNIAFAQIEADAILLKLDRAHIAASSGSACASGSMEPSHVLRAMQVSFSHLRGAVRFSLSRESSEADVDRVLEVLPQVVSDLQSISFSIDPVLI